MKRLTGFLLFIFGVSFAQLPVTALPLDNTVGLPAGTLEISSEACQELLEASKEELEVITESSEAVCYQNEILDNSLLVTVMNLGLEAQGYSFSLETANDSLRVQFYGHENRVPLMLVYKFEPEMTEFVFISLPDGITGLRAREATDPWSFNREVISEIIDVLSKLIGEQ